MYIDWYNPKRTIRDREETFSDDLVAIDLRLFGFPIVCIALDSKNSEFWPDPKRTAWLTILGFGFVFSWNKKGIKG